MKFFMKLKAMFSKNISILPFQREDMVTFVKLSNNSIKINSNVEVEENFNFVIVYYNKVCDILPCGNHKINEDSVPKLYRFSKTPLGLKALTTRSIDCDAYYINLKEFTKNHFKTIDRVVAINDGQKLKIKLDGTFTMQVCDTLKFMKALCNDYAVIRNKKTIREICATVGYEVSKALNNKVFSIDDYIFNKDKIIAIIEELVNEHTNTFGIKVSGFDIKDVVVNKKYLNEVQLSALEQTEHLSSETIEEDKNKLVEARIDALQNELGVIYAGVGERSSSGNSANNNLENNKVNSNNSEEKNKEDSKHSFEQEKIDKNVEKQLEESAKKILENPNFKKDDDEDIFIKGNDIVSNVNKVVSDSPKETSVSSVTNTNPYGKGSKDFYKQPEPKILGSDDDLISESKYKNNEIRKEIIPNNNNELKKATREIKLQGTEEQVVIKNKPKKVCSVCGAVVVESNAKFCEKCGNKLNNYKTCACCGAKNFVDATNCCVCKSVLD